MTNQQHTGAQSSPPPPPPPEPVRKGDHYAERHWDGVRERADGSLTNSDGTSAQDSCGRPLYNRYGRADTQPGQ